MATPQQVAQLRPLIDDTADPYEFANDILASYLDSSGGDLRAAASLVWGLKASRLAGLVDVTEGSSSRKLGSLYKQALEMATHYSTPPEAGSAASTRTRTRPIVRAVSYDQ